MNISSGTRVGVGVGKGVGDGIGVGEGPIGVGEGPTGVGVGQVPETLVLKLNTPEAGPSVVSLIGAIFQK